MRWQDHGILLALRPLGERQACASVLTAQHGRHLGVVRVHSKNKAMLQPGVFVDAQWNARLEEHMGTYQLDPLRSPLAYILPSPLALKILQSALSLTELLLPERSPHPELFMPLAQLLESFSQGPSGWMPAYAAYERALLQSGGISLSLKTCASTGQSHDLTYLSPKTGRAVSKDAGAPYAHLLLKMPLFLTFPPENVTEEHMSLFYDSLEVMGALLERFVLQVHHVHMPPARQRLMWALQDRLTPCEEKRIA